MVVMTTGSLRSKVSRVMSSSFSSCSTNFRNAGLPMTSTRSTYDECSVAEHQPQAATDGLLGQDVRLGRVGAKADDDRHVLDVPALPQHQHADDGVDRALALVDPSGDLPSGIEVLLGDLAAAVGVDDQELLLPRRRLLRTPSGT